MTGTLDSHGRNTVNYISPGRDRRYKASHSTGRPVSNMVKHLRADIDDEHFKRFKAFMSMEGCSTNDEFIIQLLDLYEKYEGGFSEPEEEIEEEEVKEEQPDPSADNSSETTETSTSIEF